MKHFYRVIVETDLKTCHRILRCALPLFERDRLLMMNGQFVHPEQSRSAKAERERRRVSINSLLRWLLVIAFEFSFTLIASAQSWTWISGSATSTIVPDFGTRGEFQQSNQPPPLQHAAMWTGPDGNLYLFGGQDSSGNFYNTIWEYSPSLGEWMWKRGSNMPNASTVYGTSGYPSETNDPGARSQFAWFAASTGDLWVYGGIDNGSNIYSDLWKYDFALDRWVWYQLQNNSASQNDDTVFPTNFNMTGTLGARYGSSMYVEEDSDRVWLFSGGGLVTGSLCTFSDVWKVVVDSALTYWVGGVSNPDDYGNYAYLPTGTDQTIDYPEARINFSLCRASNGKFFLFGGQDPGGRIMEDLWSWNPANEEWAWYWASNDDYQVGNMRSVYFAQNSANQFNEVGSRKGSAVWIKSDTQLVVYGGYGIDQTFSERLLNDLWSFNPSTRLWTWISGGSGTMYPVYGTKGIAADSVSPGANAYSAYTMDAQGDLWLFGGYGYSNVGYKKARNDLFEFTTPATAVFAGGAGTSQNPYQISTIGQLQSVNSYRDKYFTVSSDIDASATATWNASGIIYRGFLPIGSDASPFTGTFEGNGHTVTGLTINRGSTSAVGLFGRIDGTVKSLRLQNVNVIGDEYVGGLAGRILGEVDGCSVSGTVLGSGDAVGGLTGDVFSGSVTMSFAAATVTGGVFAGTGAGGFAGSVSSGSRVATSYATGSVTGNNRVGGFTGNNDGVIAGCYSLGTVRGDSGAGGFAGVSSGSISNSFWSAAASGQSSSAGGTNLSSAQIHQQSSFAGFDFSGTWFIWEGLSSPVFRSNVQSPPPGLTGVGMAITKNDTAYQFGTTHASIEVLGLGVDSTLFAYAGYENTQADSITFSGTAPQYFSGYRWVTAHAGNGITGDTLTFTNISGLPGAPISANIKVYCRSSVGLGNFALLASTYNSDSIAVPNAPFGEYIFGSNVVPLSVTIDQFFATALQQNAELHWRTKTEVDNSGWQVERKSTSSQPLTMSDSLPQWSDLGLVRGAGTSNAPKQYSYTDQNLVPGNYSYRLKQLDRNGSVTYSSVIEVNLTGAPRVFALSQNYPNPFNPTTTIVFTLPEDGKATLKVYDILGREVATLVDGQLKAGVVQQSTFDGSRFASGIYFARLEFNGKMQVKKMMMVK